MEDWLEKPAGKHGWLKMAGDDFVFADGTKARFWGSNISYSQMAVPDEAADQWTDKFAKHGVNLVRLHKFIDHHWAGVMSRADHLAPDPVKLYVSSLDQDQPIKTARRLLLTAFGRDANTGMLFDEFPDQQGLVKGDEPLLLEPLVATITLKGATIKAVRPLDHAGRLKDGAATVKVERGGTFTIGGRTSKTMYYLVELSR